MTTPTPRQAALERLYPLVWDHLQSEDGGEGPTYERLWEAAEIVEQAAPEKDFIREYKEIGLDLDAFEQTTPEREFKERMECWRARWEKECVDLADARAAIRGAAPLVRHGALFTHDSVSDEAACPVCQWLALPAVVAAREEGNT